MRRRRMMRMRGHAVPVTTLPADASTYGPRVLYYKYPVVASLPASAVNGASYVLDATKVEYLGVAGSWVAQTAPTLAMWLYQGGVWERDYFGCNMVPIPIKATGDGTGVGIIRLTSTVDTVAYAGANCRFYTDAAGTVGESITTAFTANVEKIIYVRLAAGTCQILVDKLSNILAWGSNASGSAVLDGANLPTLNNFNSKYIPANATYIRFTGNLIAIIGTTYAWTNATYIWFEGNSIAIIGTTYAWTNATFIRFTGNLMTISGTTYAWTNATYIWFEGNSMAISGTTQAWPNATFFLFVGNLIAISGTTQAWTNATYIRFTGNLMTISGTTQAWTNATYIRFEGNSMTVEYTTKTWRATMSRVHFDISSMTPAMVDQLMIDLSVSGTLPIGDKAVYAAGRCGAVTAASLTARNDLITKTFSVTVKT